MQSMTRFRKVGGGASALTSHSAGFKGTTRNWYWWNLIRHPELPEAGQDIRHWRDLLCHPELVSGSQTVRDSELAKAPQNDKLGFTLAEVLITLAIIGVVAALTIPTLVQSYKKKVIETRLLKFYSTMNNAIELSEIDNGPKEFWTEFGSGYETDENGASDATKPKVFPYLNEYILPYLKSVKIELPKDKVMAGFVKVYFNDGSLALMSGASIIFYPSASDYSEIREYIDGDDWHRDDVKNRGIKSFTFFFNPSSTDSINKYHYAKGVEPYAFNWNGDIDQLKNHNTIGCKETVSNERAFCTKLIQLNNWKIPDDYPFKL